MGYHLRTCSTVGARRRPYRRGPGLVVLALALLLAPVATASALGIDSLGSSADAGMRLYIRGTEKLQDRNFAGAVEDLRQAVRLRPDLAEAFHNLGYAFEQVGNRTMAIKAYERALVIKPVYPSAWNNLGYLLASMGSDLERAIRLCRRAVEAEPRNEGFRDSLGWALYKADRKDDAVQQFKAAIKLNPSYVKAQFNLGLCEYSMKHYETALRLFESAVKLEPGFIKAYLPLAACYEKTNQANKALYVFQSALTRVSDTDPVRAHIEREVRRLSNNSKKFYFTNVKKYTGKSKAADFMARRNGGKSGMLAGLSRESKRVDPTLSGGSFTPVTAVGEARQALAASREASAALLPGDPGPLDADDSMSLAGIGVGPAPMVAAPAASSAPARRRSAVRSLTTTEERALAQRYSLAFSYFERGLVGEAATELQAIVDASPEDSSTGRQARSLMLKVQDRLDQGKRGQVQTHLAMGKDFIRSGKYDLAEAEMRKVLGLNPNSAEAYKDLALLHYNTGRLPEAFEEAKRAIALDKSMKEAYVVLASLFAKKGRSEEAIKLLRRVRDLPGERNAVDELADRMMSSLQREG